MTTNSATTLTNQTEKLHSRKNPASTEPGALQFDTEIATAIGRINDALGGRTDPESTGEAADRSSDDARDNGSAAEDC